MAPSRTSNTINGSSQIETWRYFRKIYFLSGNCRKMQEKLFRRDEKTLWKNTRFRVHFLNIWTFSIFCIVRNHARTGNLATFGGFLYDTKCRRKWMKWQANSGKKHIIILIAIPCLLGEIKYIRDKQCLFLPYSNVLSAFCVFCPMGRRWAECNRITFLGIPQAFSN
jgi:hypothetical protein